MTTEDRLRAVYAAFNARDIDRVLEELTDDVDWPNAWEGGRVVGRPAVREYWTRQWAAIDPLVEPTAFRSLSDGRVEVQVHAVVRSLDGTVVDDHTIFHVYTFRDGAISRMEVATETAPA